MQIMENFALIFFGIKVDTTGYIIIGSSTTGNIIVKSLSQSGKNIVLISNSSISRQGTATRQGRAKQCEQAEADQARALHTLHMGPHYRLEVGGE